MADKKRTIQDVMREHERLLWSVDKTNYGKVAPVFMGSREQAPPPPPRESAETRELKKLATSQFLVGVGIEQNSLPEEPAEPSIPDAAPVEEPLAEEPVAEATPDPAMEEYGLESPAPPPEEPQPEEPNFTDMMSVDEPQAMETLEPDVAAVEPEPPVPELDAISEPSVPDVAGVMEVPQDQGTFQEQVQQFTQAEQQEQQQEANVDPRVQKRKEAQQRRRDTVLRNRQKQQQDQQGFSSDTPFGGLQDFRGAEQDDIPNQVAGIQETSVQSGGVAFSSATDSAMGMIANILEQSADALMDITNRLRIVEAKLERLH